MTKCSGFDRRHDTDSFVMFVMRTPSKWRRLDALYTRLYAQVDRQLAQGQVLPKTF